MATGRNTTPQDKKKEVMGKLLTKAGLVLRNGKVTTLCKTCGQEIVIKNEPLASE